jgi:hypothetical protein
MTDGRRAWKLRAPSAKSWEVGNPSNGRGRFVYRRQSPKDKIALVIEIKPGANHDGFQESFKEISIESQDFSPGILLFSAALGTTPTVGSYAVSV